ncbi:MAG: hypothetical protein H3C34_21720 [Caldilineaceae bacterium]|nr:hypothetical protein [Caldilineaceae bacterium]
MGAYPRSPKLVKGALIGLDPLNPLASVIVFQYNPLTLRRELQARLGRAEGDSAEITRLEGAPEETISLQAEFDATDGLEKADGIATTMGVYPQLSALEMLIYPKSVYVIAQTVLSALGTLEIAAPQAPLTLFVWGIKRVLPVQLSGFTIEEEAYDANLNPIRASVSLSLRVLSYTDLRMTNPAYYLFLAHQVVKETMAVVGSVSNVAGVVGGNVSLL